jgi:hypothetical protein
MIDCVRGLVGVDSTEGLLESGLAWYVGVESDEGCRSRSWRGKMSRSLCSESRMSRYVEGIGRVGDVERASIGMREFEPLPKASPTNLTFERAADSLAFGSPSWCGGVVSSIEQVISIGPLLWGQTSRRILGTSLHNETHLWCRAISYLVAWPPWTPSRQLPPRIIAHG